MLDLIWSNDIRKAKIRQLSGVKYGPRHEKPDIACKPQRR